MPTGTVYAITSPNYPRRSIGPTTTSLSQRMREHQTTRKCTSRIIIDAGDATIHPLAYVNYNTREQLEDMEAAFIMLYRASCVNRSMPGAIRRAGGITEYLQRRDAGPKRRTYELRRGQCETRRASKRASDRMRSSFTRSCDGLNRVLFN
jgi:hypothetical protein